MQFLISVHFWISLSQLATFSYVYVLNFPSNVFFSSSCIWPTYWELDTSQILIKKKKRYKPDF